MRYIERNNNIEKEYEVTQRIIMELDSDCYKVIRKKGTIPAFSKEDAMHKLKYMTNSAGIYVNGNISIIEERKGRDWFFESQYFYDYKCTHNDSIGLAKILKAILDSDSKKGKQDCKEIHQLIEYGKSPELIPYDVRLKLLEQKIEKEGNGSNNAKLISELRKLKNEMELNYDYDFTVLNDFYNQVKNCFYFTWISQKVYFNQDNEQKKVFKLK